jgi:hypothetical protein
MTDLDDYAKSIFGGLPFNWEETVEKHGAPRVRAALDKTAGKTLDNPQAYFFKVVNSPTLKVPSEEPKPKKSVSAPSVPPNILGAGKCARLVFDMLSDDPGRVESALQEARAMAGGREG